MYVIKNVRYKILNAKTWTSFKFVFYLLIFEADYFYEDHKEQK